MSSIIDVHYIRETFHNALLEDNDVNLQHYLDGFKEIVKLCCALGKIFSFVSDDLNSKIDRLEILKSSDQNGHFSTVRKMIVHENIVLNGKCRNGTATLVWLHRGFEFLSAFLKKVHLIPMEESTSDCGHNAYFETLANHHGFFVRTGVKVALWTLPTKNELLDKVASQNRDAWLEGLPRILEVFEEIETRVKRCYEEHNLLHIR